jgi:hypothetical protein
MTDPWPHPLGFFDRVARSTPILVGSAPGGIRPLGSQKHREGRRASHAHYELVGIVAAGAAVRQRLSLAHGSAALVSHVPSSVPCEKEAPAAPVSPKSAVVQRPRRLPLALEQRRRRFAAGGQQASECRLPPPEPVQASLEPAAAHGASHHPHSQSQSLSLSSFGDGRGGRLGERGRDAGASTTNRQRPARSSTGKIRLRPSAVSFCTVEWEVQ